MSRDPQASAKFHFLHDQNTLMFQRKEGMKKYYINLAQGRLRKGPGPGPDPLCPLACRPPGDCHREPRGFAFLTGQSGSIALKRNKTKQKSKNKKQKTRESLPKPGNACEKADLRLVKHFFKACRYWCVRLLASREQFKAETQPRPARRPSVRAQPWLLVSRFRPTRVRAADRAMSGAVTAEGVARRRAPRGPNAAGRAFRWPLGHVPLD